MKAKRFRYSVYGPTRCYLVGIWDNPTLIDVDHMTEIAIWRAQERAIEEGREFDSENLFVVVKPTLELS